MLSHQCIISSAKVSANQLILIEHCNSTYKDDFSSCMYLKILSHEELFQVLAEEQYLSICGHGEFFLLPKPLLFLLLYYFLMAAFACMEPLGVKTAPLAC